MSSWHRMNPEKGNQVEPDPTAYSYMQADAIRKGEIPMPCSCGKETLPVGGYTVAGGIEHRRGFCRAQELPEWWPR